MWQNTKRIFIAGLLCLVSAACQTTDAMWQSSALPSSTLRVSPPTGFIGFCVRNPDQCATKVEEPKSVVLTTEKWKTLTEVNYLINRTILFLDDAENYGRPEYWEIATNGYGDCDDYALTKRKALIEAGFPAHSLRVAIVRTHNNIGHAVLTVTTDRGDYVLDNRTSKILPWTEARYHWVSRQDESSPTSWVSLRHGYTTVASSETQQPVIVAALSDPVTALED